MYSERAEDTALIVVCREDVRLSTTQRVATSCIGLVTEQQVEAMLVVVTECSVVVQQLLQVVRVNTAVTLRYDTTVSYELTVVWVRY